MAATRLLFFGPTLGEGGADRVLVTLLENLDRTRFTPALVLVRREGPWIDRVPADVRVIDLRGRRLLFSAPALARALRAERPDVVMCMYSAANLVAVVAHRLARSRARLVLSERNAVRRPGYERRQMLEVPLKRALYPLADLVTAVSDGVARDLRDTVGLRPDRVMTVYNPLIGPALPELAATPVDHPWLQDPSSPVIVAAARLVAQKDYPTMLRAFAQIRARTPARLVILGSGPLRDELGALASELGVAQHVAFVGFDPNPFRWMSRATLLLQSSVAEGLPGTLIQSMACGTPVVATDCNFGPREIVSDGVDGFLVPIRDADALADRALRLLGDPALRERMSRAAREVGRRFTIAASLERYQQAITGRSHSQ